MQSRSNEVDYSYFLAHDACSLGSAFIVKDRPLNTKTLCSLEKTELEKPKDAASYYAKNLSPKERLISKAPYENLLLVSEPQ